MSKFPIGFSRGGDREAGSARHDNNIRTCRSCRGLVDAAQDVSGIHSNEAGAWLAAGDFGGWEWRWAGSYRLVGRHTAHPGQKVLQSTAPRKGNQWARNNR